MGEGAGSEDGPRSEAGRRRRKGSSAAVGGEASRRNSNAAIMEDAAIKEVSTARGRVGCAVEKRLAVAETSPIRWFCC